MRNEKLKHTAYVALICASLFCAQAYAGSDTTFSTPVTTLSGWLTGTMGKMFTIGALGVGLAAAITKQTLMPVAVAAGIALAASQGPAVLSGILSATL